MMSSDEEVSQTAHVGDQDEDEIEEDGDDIEEDGDDIDYDGGPSTLRFLITYLTFIIDSQVSLSGFKYN